METLEAHEVFLEHKIALRSILEETSRGTSAFYSLFAGRLDPVLLNFTALRDAYSEVFGKKRALCDKNSDPFISVSDSGSQGRHEDSLPQARGDPETGRVLLAARQVHRVRSRRPLDAGQRGAAVRFQTRGELGSWDADVGSLINSPTQFAGGCAYRGAGWQQHGRGAMA